MCIWKELYDFYDNERSRRQKKNANKQALSYEIQANLDFLAEALQNQIPQVKVIEGLERSNFDQSIKDGFPLNSITKKKVTTKTIGGFNEFKKYVGKDAAYLVKNAYSRISSLTKLVNAKDGKDYSLKIKSLFRFFILLHVLIEDEHLTSNQSKGAESRTP